MRPTLIASPRCRRQRAQRRDPSAAS